MGERTSNGENMGKQTGKQGVKKLSIWTNLSKLQDVKEN